MSLIRAHRLLPALLAAALATSAPAVAQDGEPDLARLAALEARLEGLEREIQLLEDTKAIKRLQRAYGYYVDKKLASEVAGLFADTATVELGGLGVYEGSRRIGELYARLMGEQGLTEGELHNHMILQGVVNVAEDGMSAKGRWRALIQTGQHGESAFWAEGPYENEYVKEDGVWKLSKVHWFQTVAAPYDPGWHLAPQPLAEPMEDFPPDRPPSVSYEPYPGAYQPPYHYGNPVSGRCEEGVCDAR
jgi:hypothetical protein